ncbi:MAG: hypothetical protein IJR85_06565 [Synergistaceae bacterium]|nr:hypothetical protein [Synergistaceae bacterium]
MIFTSRYANPELKSCNYTAVRISLGLPRWKLCYEIAGAIEELMPKGIFGIEDYDDFHRRYFDKLDAIRVDRIREKLHCFEKLGKPVVLLCFEDIRKGGGYWCHRNMFASWWKQHTGEVIPELQDTSKFKAELSPKPKVSQLWYDRGEWHCEDMFYQFDRSTHKKVQIADAVAKDLVAQGKP